MANYEVKTNKDGSFKRYAVSVCSDEGFIQRLYFNTLAYTGEVVKYALEYISDECNAFYLRERNNNGKYVLVEDDNDLSIFTELVENAVAEYFM